MKRNGYSLSEMLIVMAIIAILGLVSMATFVNRRNQSHLTSTLSTMAALLREAQSRSVSQASSASWGVRFENSTNTQPFFALFTSPYSSSSHAGYHPLPAWVGYADSSIAPGNYAEVTFTQISGAATGSSSVVIRLLQGASDASSTLSISPAGSVSY